LLFTIEIGGMDAASWAGVNRDVPSAQQGILITLILQSNVSPIQTIFNYFGYMRQCQLKIIGE